MIKPKEVNALTLNELYKIADINKIAVYHFPLSPLKSMAVPNAIGIDVTTIHSPREEREHLAHELGHCIKYAFYTGSSDYELKSQKEYRATKWAITHLIPLPLLVKAMKRGISTKWELAEHFDVSEELIESALVLYEEKLKENVQ